MFFILHVSEVLTWSYTYHKIRDRTDVRECSHVVLRSPAGFLLLFTQRKKLRFLRKETTAEGVWKGDLDSEDYKVVGDDNGAPLET